MLNFFSIAKLVSEFSNRFGQICSEFFPHDCLASNQRSLFELISPIQSIGTSSSVIKN